MGFCFPNIDYDQCPRSYWRDETVLDSLVRSVKGAARRKLIAEYWKQGNLEKLKEELLKDTLTENVRDELGKLHPVFMGGEYLPDYTAGEIEIARIELQSTTADVISIRARRSGELIHYSIVDEYNSTFKLPRETSHQPLSLREMVEFIDGSRQEGFEQGLAMGYNELNSESQSREQLRHFTSVSSIVYSQLREHYQRVFENWVKANRRGD